MKLRNIIIAIIGFQLCAAQVQAQRGEKLDLNLNYNVGFPVNSFQKDLIQDASPRGFTFNLLYALTSKWSVGLGGGYQDYYQREGRQLYQYGKAQEISAVVTNSIQMVPVMAKVQFSPWNTSGSLFQPYIALGAGVNFINYDQYLGQFPSSNTSTGFIGEGGLGLRVAFGKHKNVGIDIGGTYDYAPYKKFSYSDLSTVNAHVGIYLPLK